MDPYILIDITYGVDFKKIDKMAMEIGIDTCSNKRIESAIKYAQDLMSNNKVNQVVTINPEMFTTAENDKEFAEILNNAEMVIPDGIGVKIGLKIMGENVARIAGTKTLFFAYSGRSSS